MNCFICGHSKSVHGISTNFSGETICYDCAINHINVEFKITDFHYHKFEDNLSYIERIAEERKLI